MNYVVVVKLIRPRDLLVELQPELVHQFDLVRRQVRRMWAQHEELPRPPRHENLQVELGHQLWLQFNEQVAPAYELHHHDVVHFALNEVEKELAEDKLQEVITRLKQHLEDNKARRTQSS